MKELYAQILAAAELVDAIGDQAARDRTSWDAGYHYAARTFYDMGFDVGRTAAEEAAGRRWAPVAEHIHRIASSPGHAELARRRAEPGNLWRYRDGRSAEPDAFTAALIRRGVYEGGPVDWETGQREGGSTGMGADHQLPQYYVPLLPGGASRHHVQQGAA